MRILFGIVLVISSLVGIHASAVSAPHHEQIRNMGVHVFNTMASTSTGSSSTINVSPNVSPACLNTTNAINSNAAIIAANATIGHGGCFDFDINNNQICQMSATSQPITLTCNCQPVLTNTAWFFGNVSALGGQACQWTYELSMTASGTADGKSLSITANMKQTSQNFFIFGGGCSNQDMQATVDMGTQAGFSVISGLSGGLTISKYSVKVSACGVSSSKSGMGSIIGVSWFTVLCVIFISTIMMKQ